MMDFSREFYKNKLHEFHVIKREYDPNNDSEIEFNMHKTKLVEIIYELDKQLNEILDPDELESMFELIGDAERILAGFNKILFPDNNIAHPPIYQCNELTPNKIN